MEKLFYTTKLRTNLSFIANSVGLFSTDKITIKRTRLNSENKNNNLYQYDSNLIEYAKNQYNIGMLESQDFYYLFEKSLFYNYKDVFYIKSQNNYLL